MSNKYPFLDYASKEIFYHANEAAHSIDQDSFVQTFPSPNWIQFANVYERHEIRRHSQQTTLAYIFAQGNWPRLIQALQGTDLWLRVPGERYQYPFVAAFASGHEHALRALMNDVGADTLHDVTKDPGFGRAGQLLSSKNILVWAAEHGNWALVECLLASCTDKNLYSVEDCGQEVLILAAYHGSMNAIEMLLNLGVEVNGPCTFSRLYGQFRACCPLEAACSSGYEQAVILLLKRRADVNLAYGIALRTASSKGYDQIVALLLEGGAKVNAGGGDALRRASANGHQSIVEMLLRNSADVNAVDNDGRNALYFACAHNHECVVRVLLEKGATVGASFQCNAFRIAMVRCHKDIAQTLIDSLFAESSGLGGDVNHAVASNGHEMATDVLLGQSADMKDINACLHTTCAYGFDEIAQMLIERGADINAVSDNGDEDALYIASNFGHEKVVQLLLNSGADVNKAGGFYGNALAVSCAEGHGRIVQALLDTGANVNAVVEHFYIGCCCALHFACFGGNVEMVQTLLKGGADVNIVNRKGRSALWFARSQQRAEIAQLLLEHGAIDSEQQQFPWRY